MAKKNAPPKSDGSALRDWRKSQSLTLEEMESRLARACGGDVVAGFSILSRIERSKHVPTLEVMTGIYRMTSGVVTPSHFMPRDVVRLVERNALRRKERSRAS